MEVDLGVVSGGDNQEEDLTIENEDGTIMVPISYLAVNQPSGPTI